MFTCSSNYGFKTRPDVFESFATVSIHEAQAPNQWDFGTLTVCMIAMVVGNYNHVGYNLKILSKVFSIHYFSELSILVMVLL